MSMSMYADVVETFKTMKQENNWTAEYTAYQFIEISDNLSWDEEDCDKVIKMFGGFALGQKVKVVSGKYATDDIATVVDNHNSLYLLDFDQNQYYVSVEDIEGV